MHAYLQKLTSVNCLLNTPPLHQSHNHRLAMATRRSSLAHLFMVVVVLLSGAISSEFADGATTVKEACAKTSQADYCAELLASASSATDPKSISEAAIAAAIKLAGEAAALAKSEREKLPKGNADWHCMDSCATGYEDAATKLAAKPSGGGGNAGGTDGKLLEVLDFVEVTSEEEEEKSRNWEWKFSCAECKKDPVAPKLVEKNKEFDKAMEVIPALIKLTPAGANATANPITKEKLTS
ncbi:uncharacterized protein LOC100840154 [Brachypodium distachyon]|uniref:uncharacterized protein LOC100840154 n=1 Tax=Brachypodium distachyon TaxID=15368 RepID=UPI00052FDCB8|nr:uncharacterized protein LOC100840154 [Brachypodium distachyon]|eukprot:XP_003557667.2 uncharacterized protein LOC100840154 [Brachypodium distachyon]